jgi:hypothetical protein
MPGTASLFVCFLSLSALHAITEITKIDWQIMIEMALSFFISYVSPPPHSPGELYSFIPLISIFTGMLAESPAF